MHSDTMKHKASLWEGDFGTSRHVTDIHWEGDITRDELKAVADQITPDWQTLDLELDPSHPCFGNTYRVHPTWPTPLAEEHAFRILEAEDELESKYVWVHCCKHVFDAAGELEDENGQMYRQVFNTVMFCMEFTSFDDIALQCDATFGAGEWDEYELYLDDELPQPVATYA